MSFDKAKVMRAAEKNLAQGKIQAAIGDYCLIVENDAKDFNAMNLLGDLYARVGSEAEAIKCFTHIAEQYSSQGFSHKAIAMYKKIARLKPNSVEISAKLAPLYHQQGLIAEARSHYLTVADAYKANGMQLESLEILGKIADLDPNNTEVRLKLAEGYLKENEADKACEAFLEAAAKLQSKSQHEEALSIYRRILELRPVDISALKGVNAAYLALGVPEDAVAILEEAYRVQSESAEIMTLLVNAYLEAGNPAKAEETAHNLVLRDPGSHKLYLEIAQSFLNNGNIEGATRSIAACSEQLLGRGQDKDLEHWTNEILKHNPENIEALKLLVRLYGWQRDEINLVSALERLIESARLEDKKAEEHAALAQLSPLKSDDKAITNRLKELAEELGIKEETNSVWAENGVPTFAAYNQIAEDETPVGFAGNDVVENFHESALHFSSNGQNAVGWADNTTNSVDYAGNSQEKELIGAENGTFITNDNKTDLTSVSPERAAHLQQELGSVDFYISQGYKDLAAESLMMLEKQFGRHPEIEARRRNLENNTPTFSVVSETTFEVAPAPNGNGAKINATEFDFEVVPAPNQNGNGVGNGHQSQIESKSHELFATNNGIDAGLAELFDEFRESVQAEDAEANQGSDFETHYTLGLAYKEMGLMIEAVEEFQKAAKLIKSNDTTGRYLQCCHLLGHCFMEQSLPKPAITWFKKALDAPHQSDDESQAIRYELALAYEAAGEKNKASEIFSEIYAVDISYRNVGEKLRELQAL